MTTRGISEDTLLAQEACFARAFADGDPAVARDLYQPDVVYVSPTVRLVDHHVRRAQAFRTPGPGRTPRARTPRPRGA